MKILIDCVYTGKTTTCSTSYLVWKIIEEISAKRDDVFFYLMYPKNAEQSEEEMAFVNRMNDRVIPVAYPYLPGDRIEELFKTSDALIDLLAPGDSSVWDYDVVLTSRITQLPFMRNFSGRESSHPKGTHRQFIGLEEMPVFKFRSTVAWAPQGNMDLQSLAAYQAAHAVVVNNLWTKAEVMKVARKWLAPSKVIGLGVSVHESLPVKLGRLSHNVKTLGNLMTVVFAGRVTATRNFAEVADIFRTHFSFPLNKGGKDIKFIASTNSLSVGSSDVGEIDFIEVQKNNRQQFHDLLQKEAHVVVNLSTVEDFSLSTYEPLLFGVPVIVADKPWSRFLGPDYPFRVKGFTEAYTLIKDFALDYEGQMAKFHHWEDTYWKDFVAGENNASCSEVVLKIIEKHENALINLLGSKDAGGIYREIVGKIEETGIKQLDVLKFAQDAGYFVKAAASWKGTPVGRRPNMQLLKNYMRLAGWKDTLAPGFMVKE